jgi:hypothetical protein
MQRAAGIANRIKERILEIAQVLVFIELVRKVESCSKSAR